MPISRIADDLDCAHVTGYLADLSNEDEIGTLFEAIWRDFEKIDILINNAGISSKNNGTSLSVGELPVNVWNEVLAVNLTSPFLTSKQVLPGMKRGKWGLIINMSSVAGRARSIVAGSSYAASKAGLIALTLQLAGEVGAFGITANCIAPGRIDTSMTQSVAASVNSNNLQKFRSVGSVQQKTLPRRPCFWLANIPVLSLGPQLMSTVAALWAEFRCSQ